MTELPENYRFKYDRAPFEMGVYIRLQKRVLKFFWVTMSTSTMWRADISKERAQELQDDLWSQYCQYVEEKQDIEEFLHDVD